MMHDDELPIDEPLVRGLLTRQFPAWSGLPLARVESGGTVNAMFRLGDGMAVRLPLTERWGADVLHEERWLSRLGPEMPVRIPTVLGLGAADATYPSPWLVVDWIPGAPPLPGSVADDSPLAEDLAEVLTAFQRIDVEGAPPGYRSGAVRALDDEVSNCMSQIDDLLDTRGLAGIWAETLSADDWNRAPVWAHCDLLGGNVLVENGRLSGVIDFGAAGIGDPACDLMAAWSILPAAGRDRLRAAIGVDDATWLRGRGWALSQAVIALPYYRLTNPTMVAASLHTLAQLLES
jgi:aminoglycoside phosphotransferase (APT) family kinase protein